VANHPFGGIARVQACRSILQQLAATSGFDPALKEKLGQVDDQALAEIVFDCILRDTSIHLVIPSMMRVDHVRVNVRAVTHSRFTSAKVQILRASFGAIANGQTIAHIRLPHCKSI